VAAASADGVVLLVDQISKTRRIEVRVRMNHPGLEDSATPP